MRVRFNAEEKTIIAEAGERGTVQTRNGSRWGHNVRLRSTEIKRNDYGYHYVVAEAIKPIGITRPGEKVELFPGFIRRAGSES